MIATAVWGATVLAIGGAIFGLLRQKRQARRLAERSAELEQLSAELYRANRVKSEFLANVSHELRTPLAAIVGFVDLLRDGTYGELTSRQVAPMARIASSANHLRDLVEQVLDLAKMAAGRLEVHSELVKLLPFVIEVVAEVEPLLTAKGIAFSIAVPATLPRITTDPIHLRQIIVNLLGNAIKFTHRGGVSMRATLVSDVEVRTFADFAKRPTPLNAVGSFVALQVSDSGVGIAETDLERIFEEFEQVDAGPRGDSIHRGTGLGLAISRRLARLLDGDITVESVPAKGSTFTLWLPADASRPDKLA